MFSDEFLIESYDILIFFDDLKVFMKRKTQNFATKKVFGTTKTVLKFFLVNQNDHTILNFKQFSILLLLRFVFLLSY